MIHITDPVSSPLQAEDVVFGYKVCRVTKLEELRCVFYELLHEETGARHIHIQNDDPENTFGVAFKTVPRDSTGVAHILEHTVLCGSRLYPVRDPFFSMLKRSLNTFMNAFTSSDWTMYPFSTQTPKDYYNLMGVYLDAAFFPNLDELSFMQEGHRLEIETRDPLTLAYKGVVYNEMKGAMSSPDQVMSRSLLNALYPDTTYRFNSGGDPTIIPGLTWEELKNFHHRHYHPSNAYFYTYGNLPLTDHLQYIHDKVLSQFSRIAPDTDVPSQPRWKEPRQAVYHYPIDRRQDISRKSQACVAWLTCDVTQTYEMLVVSLLGEVLLANAASPLRKALMDSGLGSSLSDASGYDTDCRDTSFAIGLKDVSASDADKIQAIVFETLEKLVKNGIDRELVESAIHQIEFHRKEVTNVPYPYGLKLMLAFFGIWLHGGDPVEILNLDTHMNALKKAIAEGPFLERKIQEYFLDNPHRLQMTLVPDPDMEEAEIARTTAELQAVASTLSASDMDIIETTASQLQTRQEGTEDVSCLPTLTVQDVPADVRIITEMPHSSAATLYYDQPTSGIVYVSAALDTTALPEALTPLTTFFCYAVTQIGTALRDYTDMARRIDRYTGGLGFSTIARTRFDDTGACLPLISIGAKCLAENVNPTFEILQEMLTQYQFSDLSRLKMLLQEYQAGMESMIVQNGHRLAISLASRRFSSASQLNESWHGIHQLKTIQKLTQDLSDAALSEISGKLKDIAASLFTRNNLKLALIGETQSLSKASGWPGALLDALPNGPECRTAPVSAAPDTTLPYEGWSTSSAVSFVAQAFETVRMAHPDAPVLMLISKMSRSLYLHREVREKGGAYGGMAAYSPEDGIFCFASYRDPHIVSTLKAFTGVMEFMASGNYSAEDIQEGILQVCADIDHPDSPGQAAIKAFHRKIVGLSDDVRRDFKKSLLTVTHEDIVRVSRKYLDPNNIRKGVAVISSEERLLAAGREPDMTPFSLRRI